MMLVLILLVSHALCGVLGYLIAKAEEGGRGWYRRWRGWEPPPKRPGPAGGGGGVEPVKSEYPNADRVEAWLKSLAGKKSSTPS